MQKLSKIFLYNFKNFFITKNLGVFITKNLKTFAQKNTEEKKLKRLYIALSHGLLLFESLKISPSLSVKKRLSAARLEALRQLSLLGEEPARFTLCFYLSSTGEILVAAMDSEVLLKALLPLRSEGIIGGVFPAWVALWAQVRRRPTPPTEGLFYVKHEEGYEGFWLENGHPKGILPFSTKAAEKFLSFFKGPKEELSGDPISLLTEGAAFVPQVFSPEEVLSFEGYPFLTRPQVPAKILFLWLLPILLFGSTFFFKEVDQKLLFKLQETQKILTELQQKYRKIEETNQKLAQQKKLQEALKPYLPGERPPLLKALLEITLAFPEDAWVRRFEFRAPNQIRLWGEASNALAILEALSKNPLFNDVRFLSTVSKNPVTGKEVFSIQVTLKST